MGRIRAAEPGSPLRRWAGVADYFFFLGFFFSFFIDVPLDIIALP